MRGRGVGLAKGFIVVCKNCGAKVDYNKGLNMNKGAIDLIGSGQIDIDAVWIECNNCNQEIQVGYTMFDN